MHRVTIQKLEKSTLHHGYPDEISPHHLSLPGSETRLPSQSWQGRNNDTDADSCSRALAPATPTKHKKTRDKFSSGHAPWMTSGTTVCGFPCFDKKKGKSTCTARNSTQQLLVSAGETYVLLKRQRRQSHILPTTTIFGSVQGTWRDCLRIPWRRQLEPIPHWVADGPCSKMLADKHANAPRPDSRPSNSARAYWTSTRRHCLVCVAVQS